MKFIICLKGQSEAVHYIKINSKHCFKCMFMMSQYFKHYEIDFEFTKCTKTFLKYNLQYKAFIKQLQGHTK